MYTLHGIDVSYSQELIDWHAVATTSPALQFVMARQTHGGHGDDNMRVDAQAAANRDGMRAQFPTTARGFYHFLGTGTPTVQAAHFARITGPLQPGEFTMLDVEPDTPARVPVLPVGHIVAVLEAIEREFGRTPFLYIGRFYPGALDKRLWRFPLMLPAYSGETTYKVYAAQMGRPVVVWQWGGGTNGATVAGITGRVDSNRIEDSAAFRAVLVPAPAPPHVDLIVPPAPTEPEGDMATLNVITNADTYTDTTGKLGTAGTAATYAPAIVKWLLRDDGTKVHITQGYWVGIGSPAGVAIPTAWIDEIPDYLPTTATGAPAVWPTFIGTSTITLAPKA